MPFIFSISPRANKRQAQDFQPGAQAGFRGACISVDSVAGACGEGAHGCSLGRRERRRFPEVRVST